jgi:hypothetical protein
MISFRRPGRGIGLTRATLGRCANMRNVDQILLDPGRSPRRVRRQKAVDQMRAGDRLRLGTAVALEFLSRSRQMR